MKSLITFSMSSLFFSFVAVKVHAQLSGNQVITPEDYPVFGPNAVNNPPFCGMPYAELDLDRITAVQGMGQGGCNLCLKVTSNADPSKSVFVLAVDQGGQGLDLSTGAFQVLFGQNQSPASANWQTVSSSNCAGIWSKGSTNDNPPAPPPPPSPNSPPPNPPLPNSPTPTASGKPKRPKKAPKKSASVSVLSTSATTTSSVINPSSSPDPGPSDNNGGTSGSPSNSNSNVTVNSQSYGSSASSFSTPQWRTRLFTLGVSVMILATSAALV